MRGRDSIAITGGGRLSSALGNFVMSIMSIFFFPLVMPVVVSDRLSYNAVASYIRKGAEGSQLSLFVLMQAAVWISSFFSTLLLEKKLRLSTANVLVGTILLGLFFDPLSMGIAGLFSPSSIVGDREMLLYFEAIVKRCAMNRVCFSMIFVTAANAARKAAIFRPFGGAPRETRD